VLILIFGTPAQGHAEAATNEAAPSAGLVIRSWDTREGLPQNTVNVILQTRDGYLWLGTRDGLARFDGVRFTVLGIGDGLQSVEVQSLYEDNQGALWIGTGGGGLNRLRNGHIETVASREFLAGDNISSLTEDSRNRLWIGTRTGLSLWIEDKVITETNLAPLEKTAINALLRESDGTMLVATARQGLYEFKDQRLNECAGPTGTEKILAYCLLEDREGSLWASVGNGKVLRRQNGVWHTYTTDDGLPFVYVTSLTEDPSGTLWAGTLDDGLYRFAAGRFTAIRKSDGLSANDIRSLKVDREGNLWAGTRTGGLNRITHRELIYCGAAQGLTNDFTRSVAETADGRLWVGTIGGGIYQGSMEKFQGRQPESPSWEGPDFYFAFVDSVLAAHDGTVWYGAKRGLIHLTNDVVEHIYGNMDWLRSASVNALCEDMQGGLWVGTSEGRLEYYKQGNFTEFPQPIARGPINALARQPDGFIWVGSEAGGLRRIRAGSPSIQALKQGLASQSIRTLYLDPDQTLWIGTAGGGLSRWSNGTIHTYTEAQGLPVKTVSQIVEDDMGDLWLGSNKGIFRVHKAELNQLASGKLSFVHPRIFGINDGMPIEECSSGFCPAGLKTKSGMVCFSTVRGLVFLDPRHQETNAPAPSVLLEELLINGRPFHSPLKSSNGLVALPTESAIRSERIPRGGRNLELHYTGFSFAAPEKISFRYRLEGFDNGWVEAGGRRTAFYPNLPAGEFTFHIIACNANGLWSEDVPALKIFVEPFASETIPFRVGIGVASLALLIGTARVVERNRYKRRLKLLETQNAVARERLRISKDMHDDIGSILTQVSQLSDLGQGDSGATPSSQKQFERIGQQARSAVQSLDEIVWATNPKSDNLPNFVEYVCRFADECFETSSIRCWQEVPTTIPQLPLRADIRHNVFLGIKEAFNNALKHSHAREVWLRLELGESEVCISVKDNGNGFDPHRPASRGNGLGNMRARLEECGGRLEFHTAPQKGVEVKFIFPLPKNP